jgi:signal peptidase I
LKTTPSRTSLCIFGVAFLSGGCALPLASQNGETAERGYEVSSSAMEPTLRCGRPGAGCSAEIGDVVRVRSRQPLKRGDIVVYRTPPRARAQCGAGGIFIHRLVVFPGERWSMKAGFLYVAGKRAREPYVRASRRGSETLPPRTVPARAFLVLGDNRTQSCDSRRWGYLPAESVIGSVVERVRR